MQLPPASRRQFIQSWFSSTLVSLAARLRDVQARVGIDADGFTLTSAFLGEAWAQHAAPLRAVTHQDWRLAVGGLVDQPMALRWNDLAALTVIERAYTVISRDSSPRAPKLGHGRWRGIPVLAALEAAGIQAEASVVWFTGADGRSSVIERGQLAEALLASEINGERLPAEMGGPVRLIVPGVYSERLPGAIQRITAATGSAPQDSIPVTASFITPYHRERITGAVLLAGMAYAGDRAVSQVELSVDDGPWMGVLDQAGAAFQWTLWQAVWNAPAPGDYHFRVRAIDSSGQVQEAGVDGTGLHGIVARVLAELR
ncbi:MAG: molybdopterin-dependent oxidoreductase [Anaerolineae bacterium]|nr:molybdopterin-dependent oxidoreductase [Anaerolineae bacterium]